MRVERRRTPGLTVRSAKHWDGHQLCPGVLAGAGADSCIFAVALRSAAKHRGLCSRAGKENDLGDRILHLILPMTVDRDWDISGIMRYMVRNKMLDEIRADYVLLAKAKGITRKIPYYAAYIV